MTTSKSLLWTPKAKDRPRAHLVGGKVVTYTPRATMQAERALADQWDVAPIEGPCVVAIALNDTHVTVEVTPWVQPTSRKLRADIDNYAKLVLDALNGRAWADDHEIVQLFVRKL